MKTLSLIDFFRDYYRPNRLLGKSENTNRLYLLSIDSFGKTVGTVAKLEHLTDANVARHMQRVVDAGRSPSTANKDRAQLCAMWRYSVKIKLLEHWPTINPMTEPQRTPRAWLPDEVAKLFGAIDKQEGYFGNVPRSLWWHTLVLVLLDTGERISAIRNARWDWFSGEWFTVPAEARKGKRRDRTYRVSPMTLGYLMAIQQVSPECPFPWQYSDLYLWRLFGDLLKSAGLPSARGDKFHRIRKTTASVIHAAGMDAQDVLDHANRKTTLRYLDPRYVRTQQACDVLADFLAKPTRKPSPKRDTA